ncbi:MAG: hypothetical protein IPH75_02535 [bacterium]|nr:hypothetical protein [bacterium]
MTRHSLLRTSFLALLLITLLGGCKEKEVPYVVDENEVERYLLETEQGQELFRTEGIISTDPYTLPADSATYVDSAISHTRLINITLSDGLWEYENLGIIREGLAKVIDTFLVRTRRVKGIDTLITDNRRGFVRYGHFLKLGNDAQEYVGWVLYGFNGFGSASGDELSIRLAWSGMSLTYFDHRLYTNTLKDSLLKLLGPGYIKLTDMRSSTKGFNISSEVRNRFRLVLTNEGPNNSWENSAMSTTTTANLYRDTVQIPTTANRLYNLITLHMLGDSTSRTGRTGVFLPYRLP